MIDPARARGLNIRIGFRIGAETFLARLSKGRIAIARSGVDQADVVFTGTAPAFAAAVYGGQPLNRLEAEGTLSVKGDRTHAKRFATLFPLPPKVERTA